MVHFKVMKRETIILLAFGNLHSELVTHQTLGLTDHQFNKRMYLNATLFHQHTLRFLLYVLVLLYVLFEIFCLIFTYTYRTMAFLNVLLHEKSKI